MWYYDLSWCVLYKLSSSAQKNNLLNALEQQQQHKQQQQWKHCHIAGNNNDQADRCHRITEITFISTLLIDLPYSCYDATLGGSPIFRLLICSKIIHGHKCVCVCFFSYHLVVYSMLRAVRVCRVFMIYRKRYTLDFRFGDQWKPNSENIMRETGHSTLLFEYHFNLFDLYTAFICLWLACHHPINLVIQKSV